MITNGCEKMFVVCKNKSKINYFHPLQALFSFFIQNAIKNDIIIIPKSKK